MDAQLTGMGPARSFDVELGLLRYRNGLKQLRHPAAQDHSLHKPTTHPIPVNSLPPLTTHPTEGVL